MTRTFLKLSLVILSISTIQCGNGVPKDALLGDYELVARDNKGGLAFTGTVSLTTRDATGATGECTVIRENTAAEGVLDQTARCHALLESEKITVDFAPSLNDGGLILEGEMKNGQMIGAWGVKTIGGNVTQGKFEATKKN